MCVNIHKPLPKFIPQGIKKDKQINPKVSRKKNEKKKIGEEINQIKQKTF